MHFRLRGLVENYRNLDLEVIGSSLTVSTRFFSSPEHKVLRVSYRDSVVYVEHFPSCVVNFLVCVLSRGHIFSLIIMKLWQNVCLDEISDEFENGSCRVKN